VLLMRVQSLARAPHSCRAPRTTIRRSYPVRRILQSCSSDVDWFGSRARDLISNDTLDAFTYNARMQQYAVRIIERSRALLHSPHAPLWLAAVAFVMSLPSLWLGLQLDDRTYLRLFASGRSPLELLHESSSTLDGLKRQGVFAWWSGTSFSIHFLRPGAALTHWLEYRGWPESAWLMHLTNCALYAALVGVATLLYRELFEPGSKLAALAALMFCIDESHAQSVGWIASRHVVLATLFALLALYFHVRGRVQRRAGLQWVSVVCHVVSLLSGEFGLATLAYLVAYALVFEPGPARTRLRSIWPHLAIGMLWLSVYISLGGGVRDSVWYRDPVHAPLDVLVQGIADLPIWLVSQLGGDVASAALVLPQWLARVLALLLFLPLLALLIPALRDFVQARFFATGMLLSCVLLFATVPQDRLLLAASFGGFGWLACFIGGVSEQASTLMRTSASALRLPHLIIAPLAFIPTLGGVSAVDGAAQALAQAVPAGITQAVAVNLPLELLTNAAWSARDGVRAPLHQLYAGFASLTATRTDLRTLELATDGAWCTRPLERMFTSAHSMPVLGQVRSVDGIRVTVLLADDAGLPTRVRFEFADALDAPGRIWLVWHERRPVRWKPPPVGGRVEVPAASRLTLVF
jgi:hypothetical protein